MSTRLAWLLRHVIGGYARLHPLRAAVAVLAVAIGVALGYAVQLINASALAEFSSAVRQASGEADATISGPREGFDEAVLERVLGDAAVAAVNPVLEVEAVLVEPARLRGKLLPVVGIDALRAARLAPHLLGAVESRRATNKQDAYRRDADKQDADKQDEKDAKARDANQRAADERAAGQRTPDNDRPRLALLDDGLFLSPAALAALQLAVGDTVGVQIGARVQPMQIAGRLPGARADHIMATMDLGFAQWRFDRLGKLSRIDLQLAAGADLAALAQRLQLPAGVYATSADAASARMSNLSRAYRVNLNVLALVALFTGSFLVYSLQAQGVAARRTQLAFLRVLGATRGEVQRLLVAESVAAGVVGSALGVLAGIALAAAALQLLGGDLGGGFFAGSTPLLAFNVWGALGFFALGIAAAVIGGWVPARDAAQDVPAQALKPGADIAAAATPLSALRVYPVLAMLAAAALLLAAPPVYGIALAAYAAIGLLLVAAISVKPLLAPLLYKPLARWVDGRAGFANSVANSAGLPAWLAALRLAAMPRFAALGAAGIVASFALMVAMATMVASFRVSVESWLTRVLPADLYVRAAAGMGSSSAVFTTQDLARLSTHPAVERVEASRHARLLLDPARAPATLIARAVPYRAGAGAVAQRLPLTGAALAWQPSMPLPAWVSEPIVDLYGARVGGEIDLPIGGRSVRFVVAGVWRDYARQNGAIVIDVDDYERITRDRARSDAAVWLTAEAKANRRVSDVVAELQQRLETKSAEFAEPGALRALSLRIFDRSFAVTYVLELAAIVIGLTGIAATFSAQTFARTREFGMLRHVGVTRGQILAVLGIEALLVTSLAIVLGLAVGLAVAWVLVHIVNPQSFHWTMDLHLPLTLIAGLIVALLAASTATAVIAGRRAVSREAVWAVREDW